MADKYDIENFPKSEAAKRMMSRVSPIYENSYVGKWLFEVMGMEWDTARMLVESLRMQCFVEHCTWGMRYWEQRYGIEPDETKDLEARRAAVIAKRGKQQSLTPATLEDLLEELTGRQVTVTEDNPNYRFKVQIGEGDKLVDYVAVITKVNTVKPSHLAYSIELPRKGTLRLYFGAAMHEVKTITFTDYDKRGVSDAIWLVDENGNALADENMNIFVE